MSESELEFTIKTLTSDEVPDVTACMYLSICLYPLNPFTKEICNRKGADWLKERLQFKFTLWVPEKIRYLEGVGFKCAVESYMEIIYDVRKRFPESIEPLISLEHLARLRRSAHTEVALRAIEAIQSSEPRYWQSHQSDLADALLAKVPKESIGNPSKEMCQSALRTALYARYIECIDDIKIKNDFRKLAGDTLERAERLNTALNHLL